MPRGLVLCVVLTRKGAALGAFAIVIEFFLNQLNVDCSEIQQVTVL